MISEIKGKLHEIESRHGLDLLFAVESGSRAWGFASDDSDYDVRFVYKRPLSWYLAINERRDVVEPSYPHPLDFSGWDVQKALFQLYRGNPQLMEWLNTSVVYQETKARAQIRKIAEKYFNSRSAIYHYMHMANGNYRTYLREEKVRLKKYMYVIRPLLACQWIEERNSMPPVLIDDLIDFHEGRNYPGDAIKGLLADKRANKELGEGPRVDHLNTWIEQRLEYFGALARTTAKTTLASDDLNELLFNLVTADPPVPRET